MSTLIRSLAAVAASVATTGFIASPSHAADAPWSQAHVVFVQNDSTSGNAVTAYDRTAGGGLSQAGTYPTGGLGGVLAGSVVDHQASEGSLAYDAAHRLLFATNAGSDSVTVFAVDGDRLERRQVVDSGGSFPVSVTVHDNRVFVLNARDGGEVQGFVLFGQHLIRIPFWDRGLGLDATKTPEFVSTPGQIGFSPDGRQLVVTTKNGGNSVLVFHAGIGVLRAPVENDLPGTVPFGFDFDPAGHLVLTEAGPSAVATFTLSWDGSLTPLHSTLTGQAATCWVVAAGADAYASNAGSASLSGYQVGPGGELTALGQTATGAGTVDAAVSSDGSYLYVQSGGTGTVDAFRIGHDGSLTATGTASVPDGVGGEGIAAS
jgi:6-phosphogluconolactonase (cycloisomerase 2 family)